MNTMRVDQRNLTGATVTDGGKTRETQSIGRDGRTASSRSGGAGLDQVELSALSRALYASASSRSSRVDELSPKYRAGRYQPDPAQIGRSMLGDALASSDSSYDPAR